MARVSMSRRAVELLAENRIREAMARGELDNLPGQGLPIPGIDGAYDADWWLKGLIRREGLARREEAGKALAELFRPLRRDE